MVWTYYDAKRGGPIRKEGDRNESTGEEEEGKTYENREDGWIE